MFKEIEVIGFLRGNIEFKANNYVLINVCGVGYKVFMPVESIKNLEINSDIKVFTYTRVSQILVCLDFWLMKN